VAGPAASPGLSLGPKGLAADQAVASARMHQALTDRLAELEARRGLAFSTGAEAGRR
jgi:hypothetical protein